MFEALAVAGWHRYDRVQREASMLRAAWALVLDIFRRDAIADTFDVAAGARPRRDAVLHGRSIHRRSCRIVRRERVGLERSSDLSRLLAVKGCHGPPAGRCGPWVGH